jgi:hypothetical protein
MKLNYKAAFLLHFLCFGWIFADSHNSTNSETQLRKSKYESRYYLIKTDSTKTIEGIAFGESPKGIKTFSWDSLQIFLRDSCKNYKFKQGGGKIRGNRKYEEIREVIGKNISDIRYTYNRFLRINPKINGKVVFLISVDEKGSVIRVCVCQSTLSSKDLTDSLISKIEKWRFKEQIDNSDTTVFTYPFVFEYPNN